MNLRLIYLDDLPQIYETEYDDSTQLLTIVLRIRMSRSEFPLSTIIHELLAARQQSDANAYLPPYSTQRPPEKPRPFQPAPSYPPPSQNDVTNFPVEKPSPLYVPPNSTPRPSFPSSQRPSSAYVPQSGSTSYNPRPSQPSYVNAGSSAFPPLNPPETSSTYLPPQPPSFPSTSPRPPLPSSTGPPGGGYPSTNGYQLGGASGTSQGYPSASTGAGRPSITGGGYPPSGFRPSSNGYPSERVDSEAHAQGDTSNVGYSRPSSGYASTKPSPPFTTPRPIDGETGGGGETGSETGSTDTTSEGTHAWALRYADTCRVIQE